MTAIVNPYQEVIDWLRSDEGSSWSEHRMQEARVYADYSLVGPGAWHLNQRTDDDTFSPLYLSGVLSVKDDEKEMD